jgi:secretion/DNA translocation related TadE-like protein
MTGTSARSRRRWAHADDGSGAVLVLAATGAVLSVLVAALAVAGALRAAHSARGAADLAALGAAQESVLGAPPPRACEVAAVIATRNGARLTACTVTGAAVVTVETEAAVPLRLSGLSPSVLGGRARAGPVIDP